MAREEIKAKEKGAEGLPGEASVVSDGQRWRSSSSGGPSSSLLCVLLCFSLLLFLSSYFFFYSFSLRSLFSLFFFLSFLLLSIPILLLSSFSQFLFVFFPFFFLCFFLLSLFLCFLLFLLFFCLSLFFHSFWSSPLFSSALVLPSLVPPFLFVLPPVFIGKNRGRTWLGRPLCCRPTTAQGARSLLFSLPCGRPRVKGYTSGAMLSSF